MSSLGELFRHFAGHTSPTLIAPEGLERTRRTAAQLPGRIAHLFGLEVRLEPEPCTPDLFFALGEGGGELLAGAFSHLDFAPELLAQRHWQALRSFARQWIRPRSAEAARVSQISLEFDVAKGAEGTPPLPIIFFRLLLGALSDAQGRIDAGALGGFLTELLDPFVERPISKVVLDRMARSIAALPAQSRPYVGLMLPRDPEVMRLVIPDLLPAACFELLERLEWPGDLERVRRTTRELVSPGVPLQTNINVGREIEPYFDFEYRLTPRQQREDREFVARLEAAGLITRAHLEGLALWNGTTAGRAGHDLWPSYFLRWVNHIKVAFPHAQPTRTKAYVMCGLLPMAGRGGA